MLQQAGEADSGASLRETGRLKVRHPNVEGVTPIFHSSDGLLPAARRMRMAI
jgi:hypothetical protein